MIIYEAKIQYREIGCLDTDKLDCPEKIVEIMRPIVAENPYQERFWVIALNTKMDLIAYHLVSVGTLDSSIVHPRDVFRSLIMSNAAGFVAVHNHPSGDVTPSRADYSVTRQIKEAGKIMKIEFLDHIIIGDSYYSFNERGEL
jgi:DNA repair protein RadC